MFKDIYKRANDAIPTGAAYTRVMNRLEEPKPRRTWGKSFARAAALAACLVFTFSVVSIYESRVKAPDDFVIINAPDEPEITPEATQSTQTDAAIKPSEQAKRPATKQQVAEPKRAEQPVVAMEPVSTNEIKVNDLSVLSQSAASAYSREIIGAVKAVEIGEYREYLGKDIEAAVVLPDGFVNVTEQTAYLTVDEQDEYMSDEWSFIFEKGEAYCEIITTKKTEKIQEYLVGDYEKSVILEKDAVIFAEEDFIRAYAVSSEIGYTVTTVGVELSDAQTLLESILK